MIEEIESRLAAAQANYEQKLADAPDMRAAQEAIDLFRSEHTETKRRKEAEFAACQKAAKDLREAEAELIRAKKAFRSEHKFSEKGRNKAEEMEAQERRSAIWDAEWAAAQQKAKEKHDY